MVDMLYPDTDWDIIEDINAEIVNFWTHFSCLTAKSKKTFLLKALRLLDKNKFSKEQKELLLKRILENLNLDLYQKVIDNLRFFVDSEQCILLLYHYFLQPKFQTKKIDLKVFFWLLIQSPWNVKSHHIDILQNLVQKYFWDTLAVSVENWDTVLKSIIESLPERVSRNIKWQIETVLDFDWEMKKLISHKKIWFQNVKKILQRLIQNIDSTDDKKLRWFLELFFDIIFHAELEHRQELRELWVVLLNKIWKEKCSNIYPYIHIDSFLYSCWGYIWGFID